MAKFPSLKTQTKDLTNMEEDIKVGDLITTCYKGYYRLTKIQRRFYTQYDVDYYPSLKAVLGVEYSPLFHFIQEYDSEGKPKTGKEKACDSQFCKLAKISIEEEIKKAQNKINNLKEIYAKENK